MAVVHPLHSASADRGERFSFDVDFLARRPLAVDLRVHPLSTAGVTVTWNDRREGRGRARELGQGIIPVPRGSQTNATSRSRCSG